MITKATELFIGYLALRSAQTTAYRGAKQIKDTDVLQTIHTNEALRFLKADFPRHSAAKTSSSSSSSSTKKSNHNDNHSNTISSNSIDQTDKPKSNRGRPSKKNGQPLTGAVDLGASVLVGSKRGTEERVASGKASIQSFFGTVASAPTIAKSSSSSDGGGGGDGGDGSDGARPTTTTTSCTSSVDVNSIIEGDTAEGVGGRDDIRPAATSSSGDSAAEVPTVITNYSPNNDKAATSAANPFAAFGML